MDQNLSFHFYRWRFHRVIIGDHDDAALDEHIACYAKIISLFWRGYDSPLLRTEPVDLKRAGRPRKHILIPYLCDQEGPFKSPCCADS